MDAPSTPDERIGKLETALDTEKRFAGLDTRVSVLEKSRKENQLVILSDTLRIPMNWAFLVGLVIAAVFFACFIWLAPEKPRREIVAIFYHNKDSQRVEPDKTEAISTIFTLYTPHAETLNDLQKQSATLTPDDVKHYTLNPPDALEQFGKELKKEGAQGYSRREVWGEGTQGLKREWEWTITCRADRPISLAQLISLYDAYFHRKDKIYIKEERVGPTLLSSK
jgi:hypothetical protein